MGRLVKTARNKGAVGKHWKPADKIKAVAAYVMLNDAVKVEEVTGIPAGTIRYWKSQPWWYDEVQKVLRSQDEKIQSKFTDIVNKTQIAILDRIDNGDWCITRDGQLIRKPIAARDAAVIAAIAVDKRKVLRDSEKQEIDSLTTKERLEKLSEEFKSFIKAKTIKGEVIEVKENGETELSEGIPEREQGEAGGESPTEQSPPVDDEARLSVSG